MNDIICKIQCLAKYCDIFSMTGICSSKWRHVCLKFAHKFAFREMTSKTYFGYFW